MAQRKINMEKLHMDQVQIKDIGLFSILVNSFSGEPEATDRKVTDGKVPTVKQVLKIVF